MEAVLGRVQKGVQVTTVAIFSLFRDNAGPYINQYANRIRSLTYEDIIVYAVEGDSRDGTLAQLKSLEDDSFRVVSHNTGIERYGSVVNQRRFDCLGATGNAVLDKIAEDGLADEVLFLDSDLLYSPTLIDDLLATGKEMVAPMIMAGHSFYDIWAFRYEEDGEIKNFSPDPAYPMSFSEPFEIWSAGATVMMPASAIYNGARHNGEAIVSLCREVIKMGHKLYCDPNTIVYHPAPGVPNDYVTHFMRFTVST